MELRHTFLIIAILTIIVFVVPSIYSIFSGQHRFYDPGTSYCLKCHEDIRQELDLSGHHMSFTCENCHVFNTSTNLTHGNVVNPRCLDCHGTPPGIVTDSRGNTFLSPIAKIFGENATNKESHIPFVAGANATPFMKGENEACISCHTTKSLSISILIGNTYKFDANRIDDGTWQLLNYSKNAESTGSLLVQSFESAGGHSFPSLAQLNCEKCHPNIRNELNNSLHHTYFSCESCHQLYSVYHASSVPPCLTCHGTSPEMVTDKRGNTFIAPVASVYANNTNGADAHIPFVLSANNSNLSAESNIACVSCHSSFNNNISFNRPGFIEWDVVNSSGIWNVQNVAYGQVIEVRIIKNSDGKTHNTSHASYVDCVSCHDDIRQAVYSGGHSNEQWRQIHNYTNYPDMNSYCKSCHKPVTQDNTGSSPYPAYPFNSPVHGAMKISCMDCHLKSGSLIANINGVMQTPLYNSNAMGSIETSIAQQPAFIQSYLCISCKNTGNPIPNNSLHFKLYTEPQVTIYINGTQSYPR